MCGLWLTVGLSSCGKAPLYRKRTDPRDPSPPCAHRSASPQPWEPHNTPSRFHTEPIAFSRVYVHANHTLDSDIGEQEPVFPFSIGNKVRVFCFLFFFNVGLVLRSSTLLPRLGHSHTAPRPPSGKQSLPTMRKRKQKTQEDAAAGAGPGEGGKEGGE